MKVVHIDSGLGNQMLSYCEYLALKWQHPNEEIYIETIVYDIPECNNITNQWNGYELERIFGINVPNFKERFSEKEWNLIIREIEESKFWNKNMNWPIYFSKVFANHGVALKNIKGNYEVDLDYGERKNHECIKSKLLDNKLGNYVKRLSHRINEKKILRSCDYRKMVFYEGKDDILTGQWLSFKLRGNDLYRIESLVKSSFIFPDFINERDIDITKYLISCNSVAIHARRGDMLTTNGDCYKYGYFNRSVRYIKKHVDNPVFVFFCDPGSIKWCKENAKVFDLDFKKDRVLFVDWNYGENSFRDMQLMSYCKHAIITNSSFGWWGAYFIMNESKITISPDIKISTTLHL